MSPRARAFTSHFDERIFALLLLQGAEVGIGETVRATNWVGVAFTSYFDDAVSGDVVGDTYRYPGPWYDRDP